MAPPSSQRSATQKPPTNGTSVLPTSAVNAAGTTVNKKKQKRRQKLAARLAAEESSLKSSSQSQGQTPNGHSPSLHGAYEHNISKPRAGTIDSLDYDPSDLEETYESREGEDRFYSEEDGG